jgi:putative transcriptional regulator
MDTLKGQFLIAMPSMLDFNFSHTVTCMSEYTEDRALGVIINRVIPSLTAASIF